MSKTYRAYYFAPDDNKLRYGDGREIVVGDTHTVDVKPEVCMAGLHASLRPIDALKYAPGSQLYIVEVGGIVDIGEDKIAGETRKYISKVPNTEQLLRKFAREVALEAVLREIPTITPIVIEWLKTGDESLRSAAEGAACSAAESARGTACSARNAAESAAWGAAGSAAWNAAWNAAESAAESAVESAAESAAWNAAWNAAESTACSAAWNAAESAAGSAHNDKLTIMIEEAVNNVSNQT